MQGLAKGVLAPSTLHIFWDLYGLLSTKRITLFIDEKAYPVSKYGIERLLVRSIPFFTFRHLDGNHLSEMIVQKIKKYTTPVVVTDGWCTLCGKPAPIRDYSRILNQYNGNLIIDDTQSFGILGERKINSLYGIGGGGILKWLNIQDNKIITIVSLAKAFGVPMAVIGGSKAFITDFKNNSDTRVSSSPVSIVNLHAAENALSINHTDGDRRRKKLLDNVLLLTEELKQSGITLHGGIFPIQTITEKRYHAVIELFKGLQARGVNTVLVNGHLNKIPALSLITRSDHSLEDIQYLSYLVRKICLSKKIL